MTGEDTPLPKQPASASSSGSKAGASVATDSAVDATADDAAQTVNLSEEQAAVLAMQQIGNGRIAEAEKISQRILSERPHSPYGLHTMGLVHYVRMDYDKAIENLSHAAQIDTTDPNIFGNLGEAQRRSGKPEDALKSFERAVVLRPEFLMGHLGAGNALKDLKRYDEAIAKFRLALAINPNFAEAYHYLGIIYMELDRVDEAMPFLKKAVSIRPGYFEALLSLAGALDDSGKSEEGLAIYQRILEQRPNHPGIHNNIGNILKNLGRIDEAVEHYQKSIEVAPNNASAYYNLSRSQTGKNDDELARMEALLDDPDITVQQRVNIRFALGKIYDDLGLYDQAFPHFQQANALDDRGQSYNPDAQRALVDSLIATFTPQLFSRRKGFGSDSDLPIFIVGMPRSGTTLTEQVISSHPQVHGAGELKDLSNVVHAISQELDGIVGFPYSAVQLDAASACKLGERYASQLHSYGGNAIRVTDKMPNNFLHLGFIALMLPNARIVHCHREPLDTCLSCFSQQFTQVLPFSRDLKSLGQYYRDYDRLMAHWRAVLPMPIFEAEYAEMIGDHEGMSRRLIEFCGLEWDATCLDFHKLERPVRTASSWQVRQPIYTSSIARWRNYDKFLAPLKEAIGDVATESAAEKSPATVGKKTKKPKPEKKANPVKKAKPVKKPKTSKKTKATKKPKASRSDG